MVNVPKSKNRRRLRWVIQGGIGTIFLGSGISGAIESGFLKYSNAPSWQWIVGGTFSLLFLVSGVILLIKAAFLEQNLKS